MRNKLKLLISFASLGILLFCALNSSAQIKTGGYRDVPTDDQAVIDAAEFAANAQSNYTKTNIEIKSIEKAARQTVAGTNFKICLQVTTSSSDTEETEQFIQTIVFYSLKQEYTLKSWVKVENCE